MSRIPFGVLISIILILVSYFTSKMYALGFRFEIIASRVAFVTFLIVPILFVTSVVLARSGHIAASLYREIQEMDRMMEKLQKAEESGAKV
jgi:ABC-type multidrug transport system fused ATPase/permease subunit